MTQADAEGGGRGDERFRTFIAANGLDFVAVEMPESTHSAEDAATAIGCDVAQIAKSLVFRGRTSGDALLVIASGPNRVDETKIAAIAGEPFQFPDAGFVRDSTGYSIGGVPPFGHDHVLRTLVDEDLVACSEIWAAAGTPRSVFRLSAADLVRLSGGRVVAIH
jgi:prolyl-tRNA editing enzyme YbaK/EbsC (Cys-tRNA(Pro) deacylase)